MKAWVGAVVAAAGGLRAAVGLGLGLGCRSGTGWVVVQRTTRLSASTLQSPLSCPDPVEDGDGVVGLVGVLTLPRSSHVGVALLRELRGRREGGDELGAHGLDGGVEGGGGNGRG